MPWFAWLWCIGMVICLSGIAWETRGIKRAVDRMKRHQ